MAALIYKDLCGSSAAVVIRRLHHAVRARRTHRKQGAFCQRQLSIMGQKIAAFAHRAHQIPGGEMCIARRLGYGRNLMKGLIQSGSNQIVHGGIDHGEVFVTRGGTGF